ncbi:MAG: hypothetical protein H0Z35_03685 [Thermoanaerobacteraceae bacterium]|nr:hypothetical protein [Thermoanaerobacteraceae bacterium]
MGLLVLGNIDIQDGLFCPLPPVLVEEQQGNDKTQRVAGFPLIYLDLFAEYSSSILENL